MAFAIAVHRNDGEAISALRAFERKHQKPIRRGTDLEIELEIRGQKATLLITSEMERFREATHKVITFAGTNQNILAGAARNIFLIMGKTSVDEFATSLNEWLHAPADDIPGLFGPMTGVAVHVRHGKKGRR